MKKVVSFSGGRTSAYLCKLMIDKFGGENVDFIYMDTGAEHPETYEFIRNANKYLDLNLVCLRLKLNPELGKGNSYDVVSIDDIKPDLKPFKDMMSKYGVPYIGGMFCTDRMKLTPFKKYCDDTYGKNNYETWLGIRADEVGRVVGEKLRREISHLGYDDEEILNIYKMDYVSISNTFVEVVDDHLYHKVIKRKESGIKYMAEITEAEKKDVLDWWGKQPFDLEIDEWSGNCVFCPKKSNLKLAASQRDNPKEYIEFLDALHSDEVRVDDNTGNYHKMYRGNQSLDQLIAKFDGSTGDEIKARIRGGHHIDTNSCSESCEVFSE